MDQYYLSPPELEDRIQQLGPGHLLEDPDVSETNGDLVMDYKEVGMWRSQAVTCAEVPEEEQGRAEVTVQVEGPRYTVQVRKIKTTSANVHYVHVPGNAKLKMATLCFQPVSVLLCEAEIIEVNVSLKITSNMGAVKTGKRGTLSHLERDSPN